MIEHSILAVSLTATFAALSSIGCIAAPEDEPIDEAEGALTGAVSLYPGPFYTGSPHARTVPSRRR